MASQNAGGGGGSKGGYRPPPRPKPKRAVGKATPRKAPSRTGLEPPAARLTEEQAQKRARRQSLRDYQKGVAGSSNTASKAPKPVTRKPVPMPAIQDRIGSHEFTMSKEEIDRIGKREAKRRYEAWKRRWST